MATSPLLAQTLAVPSLCSVLVFVFVFVFAFVFVCVFVFVSIFVFLFIFVFEVGQLGSKRFVDEPLTPPSASDTT